MFSVKITLLVKIVSFILGFGTVFTLYLSIYRTADHPYFKVQGDGSALLQLRLPPRRHRGDDVPEVWHHLDAGGGA